MAYQIILRGFTRAPVGCDRGKFLDDERLDVRDGRLLVIDIRADVSNVRIRQADNLARVTRIGKNFLIPGQAGIENDFAAAPGDRSRGAPLKNAPIFERKNCRSCFRFRPWTRVLASLKSRLTRDGALFHGFGKNRDRSEMIHRPIREHSLAVDKFSRHRPENS